MATDVRTLRIDDNRKPAQALRVPAPAYVTLFRRELEQWLQRKADVGRKKHDER